MIITMPCCFDLKSSLEFCNTIDSLDRDDEYIYDYKNTSTVEPFGMLLIGSKIRRFVSENKECQHRDTNFRSSTYAAHMGYFQSVYQDYGKKPGEASGSSTYIPITDIDIKESYKLALDNSQDIYQYIESTSLSLADVLSRKNNKIRDYLKYSIRELIRNVYEHSYSQKLWFAGQYWPSQDLVEIAILDEGVGIKESFKKNKKIQITSDIDAIQLALEPGISRNVASAKVHNNDVWANSGYGLYMTSNICKLGGDFTICTGSSCLNISNDNIMCLDTNFKGTAIRMRLKPSVLPVVSNMLKMLSQEGAKRSKYLYSFAEISASVINNDKETE